MVKAVIFDMDGLLIDSEPFWRAAHRKVLKHYGFEVSEDDVRNIAGKGTLAVAEHWQQRFGFTDPSVAQLKQEIVQEVMTAVHLEGVALPGVQRLIKVISDHGLPMAVASSSAPELIDRALHRLGIRQYMQAVHSGEHEERGKPFPDVFLSTAKTLCIESADCIVFEDSLNGVKAAKAAGMKCVAVPELPYDEPAFQAAKPDAIFASLEEVDWHLIQTL